MVDLAKKVEESLPLQPLEHLSTLKAQRYLDAKTIAERIPARAEFLNKVHDYMLHPRKESPYEWLIAKLTGEVK